ncbi:MAG TPA: alpha-L-glutamate ligase-like protein [Gammaproteobacteria bacterium]|nr:alpha-L-glutamate ligase-like protein [Gammaproteobacteria bacterium]HRP86752.1 alpha-L-glutamate ligase-like protein [Gammaproteobacteria bacterium]
MWRRWRALNEAGVMGINRRNSEYIMALNPRRNYPIVDNKLLTKELAIQHGVPVPELYGAIATPHDIRNLPAIVAERQDFVLKPAHGSQGDGIIVIVDRRKGRYRTSGGRLLDWDELEHHLTNTLSGQFSLGGLPDKVMVEYRVRFDPVFEEVSFQGVPDLRVIVYRGFPVMSMVRLPTRQSDGKANLHQGAVGSGIEIATGRTLPAVGAGNVVVDEHPDTGAAIAGRIIPHWKQILLMAARCHELTGLGYLGADIVLDANRGPLLLELNARPGLNVQIANQDGLRRRIKAVDPLAERSHSPEERVALARELARHGFRGARAA